MQKGLAALAGMIYRDFVSYSNERLEMIGLSNGLLYFILYIGKHPECSPGEISSKLKMDTGHTTRSLNKLVELGFVVREKNLQDKRAYMLNLTNKGQYAFQLSKDLFAEWDEGAVVDLTKEEQDQLQELLSKVLRRKRGHLK